MNIGKYANHEYSLYQEIHQLRIHYYFLYKAYLYHEKIRKYNYSFLFFHLSPFLINLFEKPLQPPTFMNWVNKLLQTLWPPLHLCLSFFSFFMFLFYCILIVDCFKTWWLEQVLLLTMMATTATACYSGSCYYSYNLGQKAKIWKKRKRAKGEGIRRPNRGRGRGRREMSQKKENSCHICLSSPSLVLLEANTSDLPLSKLHLAKVYDKVCRDRSFNVNQRPVSNFA